MLTCSVCAMMLFAHCSSHQEEKKEENKFLVTRPLVTDTVIVQKYVSQIRSFRHIEIRSQERGYLERIYVDEGQFVKAGQLLYQIMPTLYNAELAKANAEIEALDIELQNTQSLSENNIVSPNEVALIKAKLKKAQAEASLAKTHLQFTRITAPFSGYIDHLNLKLGSMVEEGDLLTSLSDNSEMWVYFNVPESEYLNYKTNVSGKNMDQVQLMMANQAVYDQYGKVTAIEADFNNETGNIAFRATFPNPDNLLRNGQTGTILMSIPVQHAVIIPQKATFEIMDKKYVYVVTKNNEIRLTPITVKAEMPDLYIIATGLNANDQVLLEGLRKVQDKDRIEYEFQDIRQVMQELNLPSE